MISFTNFDNFDKPPATAAATTDFSSPNDPNAENFEDVLNSIFVELPPNFPSFKNLHAQFSGEIQAEKQTPENASEISPDKQSEISNNSNLEIKNEVSSSELENEPVSFRANSDSFYSDNSQIPAGKSNLIKQTGTPDLQAATDFEKPSLNKTFDPSLKPVLFRDLIEKGFSFNSPVKQVSSKHFDLNESAEKNSLQSDLANSNPQSKFSDAGRIDLGAKITDLNETEPKLVSPTSALPLNQIIDKNVSQISEPQIPQSEIPGSVNTETKNLESEIIEPQKMQPQTDLETAETQKTELEIPAPERPREKSVTEQLPEKSEAKQNRTTIFQETAPIVINKNSVPDKDFAPDEFYPKVSDGRIPTPERNQTVETVSENTNPFTAENSSPENKSAENQIPVNSPAQDQKTSGENKFVQKDSEIKENTEAETKFANQTNEQKAVSEINYPDNFSKQNVSFDNPSKSPEKVSEFSKPVIIPFKEVSDSFRYQTPQDIPDQEILAEIESIKVDRENTSVLRETETVKQDNVPLEKKIAASDESIYQRTTSNSEKPETTAIKEFPEKDLLFRTTDSETKPDVPGETLPNRVSSESIISEKPVGKDQIKPAVEHRKISGDAVSSEVLEVEYTGRETSPNVLPAETESPADKFYRMNSSPDLSEKGFPNKEFKSGSKLFSGILEIEDSSDKSFETGKIPQAEFSPGTEKSSVKNESVVAENESPAINRLENSLKPDKELNEIKSEFKNLVNPGNIKTEATAQTVQNLEFAPNPAENNVPQEIIEQVETSLRNAFTPENLQEVGEEPQILKMRLRPAELGEVEIKLEKNNLGKLSVHFETENETTGKILAESLDKLQDSLQDAGWQIENLDLSNSSLNDSSSPSGFEYREELSREEIVKNDSDEKSDFDDSVQTDDSDVEKQTDRLVNLRA